MTPVALPPPAPTWSSISYKAFSLDHALITLPEFIKQKNIRLPSSLDSSRYPFPGINVVNEALGPKGIVEKSYALKEYLVEPPIIFPVFPAW